MELAAAILVMDCWYAILDFLLFRESMTFTIQTILYVESIHARICLHVRANLILIECKRCVSETGIFSNISATFIQLLLTLNMRLLITY